MKPEARAGTLTGARPCDNDPLAESFLDAGERMGLIDWADFEPAQDEALLGGYFGGAAAAGRTVIATRLCALVRTLWGLIQAMNEAPADDFWASALHRFERCRRRMASAESARAIKAVRTG